MHSSGYQRIHLRGGKKEFRHRLTMMQMLGRPLNKDESVHHKNGDRLDNRPENLELWSRYQPYGQRVTDKVAFAIEVLTLYPEFAKDAGVKLVHIIDAQPHENPKERLELNYPPPR